MILSENAKRLLETRYLLRDLDGAICETPEEMFQRSAKVAAQGNSVLEKEFLDLMLSLTFLPNSPCLMNAGTGGSLLACHVLPIEDTMKSIFKTLSDAAMVHKHGGGVGFSFSRLRSKGATVGSTHGTSSGPLSFLLAYNAATEAVKQGGTRRGANMAVLRCDHPDILDFIKVKRDPILLQNFNLSVGITDKFMAALAQGGDIILRDPHTGEGTPYSAQELWDTLTASAWSMGEPGVIFLDRIQAQSPTNPYETIEATNACSELPLAPYDSCCLGSLRLSAFVASHPDARDVPWAEAIDWDHLEAATRTAVRFLDALIDVSPYILPEIEAKTKQNRKIGLGVMGWADMLVHLGVPYDSPVALEIANAVMERIKVTATSESENLASEKVPFPMWDQSTWVHPMRNAVLTTVAPTGSISIIAGCSSGIEPLFALSYTRRCLDSELPEVNTDLVQALQSRGLPWLPERIAASRSIQAIEEIPEDIREIFRVSEDITPAVHIAHQAAFQSHCHSAVSKTVNLPPSSTQSDVAECFLLAWSQGCKGVAVYRDGSRSSQVLDQRVPRPQKIAGSTVVIETTAGKLYVTLNTKDGRPFEVFCQVGKAEPAVMAETEAIARLISLALRSGVTLSAISEQLAGVGEVGSIPSTIAEVLSGGCPDCGPKKCPIQ